MEINKIYNEDNIETMKRIKDSSVDLVVTSPPYNKGHWSENRNLNNGFKTKSRRIVYGDFDDNINPEEYENQQKNLLKECLRIIKPTGSIFYNHIDILHKHNTIHPKYIYDFPLKQIIIWNKKNTPKLDKSYFFPVIEYIFWIKKDNNSIPKFDRKNSFMQKNVWEFSSDNNNNHPAPFPLKLVENCILSTTNEDDLIYDPYMGSGTTAIASIKLNRNFIGSEIVKDYCDQAINRIKTYQSQTRLF